MKLSPKAHRFIARAIRDFPDVAEGEQLRAWAGAGPGNDLPAEIAPLVLNLLSRFEGWMKERLGSGRLDEDQRAETINDLRFIYAIQSDIREDEKLEQHA
jgi:hypothetical protein